MCSLLLILPNSLNRFLSNLMKVQPTYQNQKGSFSGLWLVVLVIVLKVLKFCFIHWFEPFWFWYVGWTFIKLLRNLFKLLGRIRRRLHIILRRKARVSFRQTILLLFHRLIPGNLQFRKSCNLCLRGQFNKLTLALLLKIMSSLLLILPNSLIILKNNAWHRIQTIY
jgi:hypothetical protein